MDTIVYHVPMEMQPFCLESLLEEAGIPASRALCGPGTGRILGLAYDSRDVEPGFLFFALRGVHTDGHQFIGKALRAGASGIVHSLSGEELEALLDRENIRDRASQTGFVSVRDTRRAMSSLSAAFYGRPGNRMTLVGVTGTDGNSSTVSVIHQRRCLAGVRAGYLSTVSYDAGGGAQVKPCRQSTPEAPVIHRILREMADSGCTCAVIEATSHGLSPRNSRLADIPFQGAVLTNVTQEHLEFHGTLEQYRQDKAELFRAAARHPRGFAVINGADPHRQIFEEAAGPAEILLYNTENTEPGGPAETLDSAPWSLAADRIQEEAGGSRFHLTGTETGGTETGQVETRLPGRFNIDNLLAALLAVSRITSRNPADLAPLAAQVHGVAGRMEIIRGNQPFTVLVDYAHTPGSFEKILPGLRKRCPGRLILVFGSAGERDRAKRPRQGALAADYADTIILTDEDPRLEDREGILKEIAAGVRERIASAGISPPPVLTAIPDRRCALRRALDAAQPGDTVAALGKGHEESIIQADGPHPWLESRVLRELLKEAGYETED